MLVSASAPASALASAPAIPLAEGLFSHDAFLPWLRGLHLTLVLAFALAAIYA